MTELPILVVEDEDEFRQLIVEFLNREGFNTIEARSGNQAMRTLQMRVDEYSEPSIKAIVTDCRMPDGDGLTLLRKIRTEDFEGLPVLIISGVLSYDEIRETAHQEPVEILIKPFQRMSLLEKLQQLMKKPSEESDGTQGNA